MALSPQQQQLSLRHNVSGTVYVLHFDPAYKHAQHYVGWIAGDVVERVAVHLRAVAHRSCARPSRRVWTSSSLRPTRGRGTWSAS
jgi:hypothetical protein